MKQAEFTIIAKKLRTNANLSLRQLAESIGVSTTYIHDLEKGNREPTETIINSFISFYQLDYDQQRLLYDSVANSSDSLPLDVTKFLKDNPDELMQVINIMNQKVKRYKY